MMDSKALTEAWPSKTASMTGEESQQGSPEQPSGPVPGNPGPALTLPLHGVDDGT